MKMGIPIGIQDYRKLRGERYFTVDKSLMIKEFLERRSEVTLVTRPRRFGKTLNMSMLAEFFDITKDSKVIFDELAITNTPYTKEMNQHPVIFVSFKDCKGTYEDIVKYTKLSILNEFKRYKHIFESMNEFDIPRYEKMIECLLNDDTPNLHNANNAIAFLANQLEAYYNKKVMVFIDEYDTPFVEAHIQGCYEELHHDLASLLRTALKGCDSVNMAMLTGIQRVAKENVFSDLNNLVVCTVKDNEYAQYFGFTKEETQILLESYDLAYSEEVKQMYDGYRIGGVDIYNPWSIINYASRKKLEPFWVNTSSNKMIKKAMENCDQYFREDYGKLIEYGYVETMVFMETSFYEQSETPSLWGLFVNAGYLTIEQQLSMSEYSIRIPNNEVKSEFMSLTAYFLHVKDNMLNAIFTALKNSDMDRFIKYYQEFIYTIASYHDTQNENSIHMLLLGMCSWLSNDYEIRSNRESGNGRADLILKKKNNTLPNIVIECKFLNKANNKEEIKGELSKLAQDGLDQIKEKNYMVGLNGKTLLIGLAHHSKEVYMEYEEMNLQS